MPRPKRWEQLFTLCGSCVGLARSDTLCHVFRKIYFVVDYSKLVLFLISENDMELRKRIGVILVRMSTSSSIPTLERIAFGLRAEGIRISENQLKQELSLMEDRGVVEGIKIDYTQVMIEWLLHQVRSVGLTCPSCERPSSISLYCQFSDDTNHAKRRNVHRKVGSYCVNCGRISIDAIIGSR
ncbi:MAG: hypothetical protein JRN52_07310 [Nitrososphaerota archaeon]|nr:hypothetical protein [Nitrososphaerota archaeon]